MLEYSCTKRGIGKRLTREVRSCSRNAIYIPQLSTLVVSLKNLGNILRLPTSQMPVLGNELKISGPSSPWMKVIIIFAKRRTFDGTDMMTNVALITFEYF